MTIKTIIFDFGGVLIDWNPEYYYSTVFDDEEQMKWFLENVCTTEWNIEHDRGRPFAEGIKLLKGEFPEYRQEIENYFNNWEDMLNGEIPGSVDILKTLKKRYRVYGLTNWSAETFPTALELFDFLHLFEGIVVSGDEKMIKPDKEIFQLLLDRYGLKAEDSLFIDDNADNIEAAREMGFNVIHFKNSEGLKRELKTFGITV